MSHKKKISFIKGKVCAHAYTIVTSMANLKCHRKVVGIVDMEEEEKRPQPAMKEGEPPEDGQKRKPPPPLEPQKCPRCDSTSTKFCYYNNYSLSQPRYFCKTCKRYWTKGGSLRNIPFGGGSRKAKRTVKSSTTTGASSYAAVDIKPLPSTNHSSLANTHNQLQHQLFLTKARAAAAANATAGIGSLIHQSMYGLGGIEGNGYYFHGLTTLPTIQQSSLTNIGISCGNGGIGQEQMADLRHHHHHLPSLHGHEFMNFRSTGVEGSSPANVIMPMVNGGASSSSPLPSSNAHHYGWQQRNVGQISATTVGNTNSTPVAAEGQIGRNSDDHLWLKHPYV